MKLRWWKNVDEKYEMALMSIVTSLNTALFKSMVQKSKFNIGRT